ncbi:MAG: hypothetical protein ACP5VS_14145, partial [Desulfomonilaceae bacterium]
MHGRPRTTMIDYLPLKRSPGSRTKFDRQISAICQECGVGCGLVAYMRQGRIVDVHGDEQHPVSRGRLCAAGISFPRALYSLERFKKPFFRSSPGKETNELDNLNTALDILAERLKRTRDLHGPEALFIGCDTKAGLGFYYGA